MKKIIALIPFLSLGFIFSCSPKSEVLTESEWNEAIENIVHVNKNNVLNYKAEGDLKRYKNIEKNRYDTIKSIEINEKENISKRHEERYSKTEGPFYEKTSEYDFTSLKLEGYYDLYGVHRVNHIIPTKDTSRLFEFHLSDRIDVFDKILDLYGNYKSFNFVNNHYISKTVGSGYRFNVDITIVNKKIKTLNLDYLYDIDGVKTAINGDLTFSYGTSTLSKEDLPSDYDELMKKKMNDVSVVESLVDGKQEIFTHKNFTSDANLFQITCETDKCNKLEIYYECLDTDTLYPFSYLKKSTAILKDGDTYTILNRGSKVNEGDYWFDNVEPTYELAYKKLVFKKPLEKNQILYFAYEGATSIHAPTTNVHISYAS